nr:MAG TPA: Integrase [Bacteriophage sp.]DAF25583.1 MAG TPA: Integrase [Caudoviricetes sp.]DAJ69549.1 MAG TPA: Integrase [Caudoviricetes sp.]
MLLADIGKRLPDIKTNDIRYHLAMYQTTRNVEKATVDNRRRNLSAFFSWLTKEEYIEKNPMLRIGKIKSTMAVRKSFSDGEIEMLKNASIKTRNPKRDRALIEFLLSTG